jgi:hypothetical protein
MNKELAAKRQALEAELTSDITALRRKQVFNYLFTFSDYARLRLTDVKMDEVTAMVEKEKSAIKAQATTAATAELSAQKTAHSSAMTAQATSHRAELDKADREHKTALQVQSATQKAELEKARLVGEVSMKKLHSEIEQLRDACERDLQTQRELLAKNKV